MEEIIKIDLYNKDDVLEKYNKDVINKELINYIVDNAIYTKKNIPIKLIINNNLNNSYIDLIKESLLREYNNGIIKHIRNHTRQIIYLLIGVLLLFISTIIERTILKEVILIGGWVLIWEMMELVIFSYTSGRRKKNILNRIINGEIIENMINQK